MLTKAKKIQGFTLRGTDEEVGSVKEFLFDDKFWTVRYLVANTGGWLSGRQVLISPYFLLSVDYDSEIINVGLTKSEIENSPSLDSDKPVSRQYEEDYYVYYRTPMYWTGPYMGGAHPEIIRDREKWTTEKTEQLKSWDPNLRSTREVSGYNIKASDDEIGHVDDFILDDQTWAIRYFIVDTRNWWPGKKVLVSTRWIDRISWDESKVFVGLSRDAIKQAPEYTEDYMLTRDYESRLHQYYKRKGYWSDEPVSKAYSQ